MSCLTVTPAPADTTALPEGPAAKALQLHDLATSCQASALASIATTDRTRLSFGLTTPVEAFALPQPAGDNRYDALVRLLALPPVEDTVGGNTTYVWPRVHIERFVNDDAAWQEVVDAGLATADQASMMRQGGSGYLGYRLGIGANGQWQYLVGGD